MNNFKVIVDGETTTLSYLLKVNREAGVDRLDPEDVDAIKALQAGQSHYVGIGGGWIEIHRPIPARYYRAAQTV